MPAFICSGPVTGWCTAESGSPLRSGWTTQLSPRCARLVTWRRCTTRRIWPASRLCVLSCPTCRKSPCSIPRSTRRCRRTLFATRYPRSGTRGTGCGVTGSTASVTASSASRPPPCWAGRPGELRLVTAHLGNGCSATAVRDGVSVDTTMGLTPLDGLVMGTRSGDVDPGLLGYLAGRTGMSVDELTEALNIESGLEGLSGVGNDMRTVVAAAAGGNERARLALEVFVHRLSKAIAGLVVGLAAARRAGLHRRHRGKQRRRPQPGAQPAGFPRPG